MSAPFRDSTEAQIAALRERVEALDLEVKARRREPAAKPAPKPPSVASFVYRVLAMNVALAWVLIGGCAHFDAPNWVIGACSITGGVFVMGSVGTLFVRMPS